MKKYWYCDGVDESWLTAEGDDGWEETVRKYASKYDVHPAGPYYLASEVSDRMVAVEKFFNRISKDGNGCWLWTGSLTTSGYGQMRFLGGRVLTHRFSFETFRGPVPDGLDLDHLCRVRACANPDHLEAVTRSTNNFRGEQSARVECPNGHEYTAENTYRGPDGHKRCRQCQRALWAKENERRRQKLAAKDAGA